MTRVAVDATSVSPQAKGIGRVQAGAVRALTGRYDLLAYVSEDVDLPVPTARVRRRPALVWEQVGLARAARRADAVLTWTERLPVAGAGRYVVWLFELPLRRIERNRPAATYQRASDLVTRVLWRRSLRRAARVIAASNATADDLRRALPELGETPVVYPGIDARFSPGPGEEGRYVLHVTSPDPRENAPAVAEAVRRANERLKDPVRLVAAGAGSPLGRVSDERLVALYRGAVAYIDASVDEGFGLQPLEAMACGAPVIASDVPAVREVAGEAGILYAPGDVEGRASGLVRIVEEPGLAERMRAAGLARAAEFTWERTAHALAAVLDEVIA